MIRALLLHLPASLAALAGAPPQGDSPAAAVAGVLERVAGPADVGRAGNELARQGARALEPLFGLLRDAAPGTRDARELARSAAVATAFARFPREAVLALLARVARAPDDPRARAAALAVLGLLGRREDFRLALELAFPLEAALPPPPEVRAALLGALLAIGERDPGALRVLAGYFASARPAAQAAIVAALGRSGRAEALAHLAGLLGRSAGADALVLLELGALAERTGGCDDRQVHERVRGILGHPDKSLAVQACLVTARLRDHECVPDLIVLLGDRDANVRRSAHAALASLTGLSLGVEQAAWIAWLDAGLAWWDERAGACRAALVSGTAAEAAAALADAAGQRLFVDQVVGILALGLARPEPDLVAAACRALAGIDERAAREALAPLLHHSDPALRERARLALLAGASSRGAPARPRRLLRTRSLRGLQ